MVQPANRPRAHQLFAGVAVTGRLASSDPNLQNIPVRTAEGRRIREAFIAPPGQPHRLGRLFADRAAHHGAPVRRRQACCSAFAAGPRTSTAPPQRKSSPLHADEVSNEQRRYAKVINFGLIYGMSAFGLAVATQSSNAAPRRLTWTATLPAIPAWPTTCSAPASRRAAGLCRNGVRPPLVAAGNQRQQRQRRQGAERAAINAPMQGTAADLIKLAMIAVQGWLEKEKLHTRLIMQVHDELVLEVPERELDQVRDELPAHMCNVAALKVPLRVGVGAGNNWEAAH